MKRISCNVFFLKDARPTEIYPLSPPGALPISMLETPQAWGTTFLRGVSREDLPGELAYDDSGSRPGQDGRPPAHAAVIFQDRKSTRLNSSHANISYAVFCLKKKKHKPPDPTDL